MRWVPHHTHTHTHRNNPPTLPPHPQPHTRLRLHPASTHPNPTPRPYPAHAPRLSPTLRALQRVYDDNEETETASKKAAEAAAKEAVAADAKQSKVPKAHFTHARTHTPRLHRAPTPRASGRDRGDRGVEGHDAHRDGQRPHPSLQGSHPVQRRGAGQGVHPARAEEARRACPGRRSAATPSTRCARCSGRPVQPDIARSGGGWRGCTDGADGAPAAEEEPDDADANDMEVKVRPRLLISTIDAHPKLVTQPTLCARRWWGGLASVLPVVLVCPHQRTRTQHGRCRSLSAHPRTWRTT